MNLDFSKRRKSGKAGKGLLMIGGIVAGVFVVFSSGAFSGGEEAAEDLGEQFGKLSMWDKLLLGVGIYDPEDVFDLPGESNAVSGVRIARS